MTTQYLRNISLTVTDASGNGLDFRNFHCKFSVRRGDRSTPNSLDARIFNLKASTAKQIGAREYTRISLSVGYQGLPIPATPPPPQLIFDGTIKQFRNGRLNQTETYVDITAADGDEAYNWAPVIYSVPAGSNQNAVLQRILAGMRAVSELTSAPPAQEVTLGYVPPLSENGLIRGKVLYGMARNAARQFADTNGLKWSFQDGQLTMIPVTSYVPTASIPVIGVSTGLIGVPELTQQGLMLKTLMNPAIKIGQLIQLDTNDVNRFRASLDWQAQPQTLAQAQTLTTNAQGLYYVMSADHEGDTRGNEWYTTLTCLSVDASLAGLTSITSAVAPENTIQYYGQGP